MASITSYKAGYPVYQQNLAQTTQSNYPENIQQGQYQHAQTTDNLNQSEPKYLTAKIGAVKAPKASTLKQWYASVEEWFTNYINRPHRYNMDRIENNIDNISDILDINQNQSQSA